MSFQRRRYASLTHSSASSSSPRMFFAMYPQYLPYFSFVRAIPYFGTGKKQFDYFFVLQMRSLLPVRFVKAPYINNNRKSVRKLTHFLKIFSKKHFLCRGAGLLRKNISFPSRKPRASLCKYINKFVFFGKTLYKRKSLCYNLICENSAAQPADIRFF